MDLFDILLVLPLAVLPMFYGRKKFDISLISKMYVSLLLLNLINLFLNTLIAMCTAIIFTIIIALHRLIEYYYLQYTEYIVVDFDSTNNILMIYDGHRINRIKADKTCNFLSGEIIRLKTNCLYNYI